MPMVKAVLFAVDAEKRIPEMITGEIYADSIHGVSVHEISRTEVPRLRDGQRKLHGVSSLSAVFVATLAGEVDYSGIYVLFPRVIVPDLTQKINDLFHHKSFTFLLYLVPKSE